MTITLLKFGLANAKLVALQKKLKRKVFTISTLSGYACPFAEKCLSKAVIGKDGKTKIKDGPKTEFRCFSASQEVIYPAVYASRKYNFDLLRKLTAVEQAKLILASLPPKAGIVRIHVAGDFFNQANFDAWLAVATFRPNVLFYAYTKSLPYWVKRLGQIPPNLVLTASYGGRCDDLIAEYGLRSVKVVYSVGEARRLKLPIDHDDSHAAIAGGDFALLIHGIQPAKSKAGKAVAKLDGVGSYRR